jgi:myo-inositol catabolism protein IolH
MKIALDPYMHRHLSLPEVARLAADLGYEYIELSPRADFFDWFVYPRLDSARIREFKTALKETGVKLASLLPLYRWASPHEDERRTAVRCWKRAIEVAVEIECMTMNSEFSRGPSPRRSNCCAGPETLEQSEPAFWASMEELIPIFQKEGITLHLEPHPDDFVEDGNRAVDIVRALNSPNVKYLYCAPHTYHMGNDLATMIRYSAPVLAHVHVADTLNHKASSGLRYIVNPPGSTVRVHQHLNIGEGEVDWDVFFGTLQEVGFDGIITSCVFAWEDRAVESSRLMLEKIKSYLSKYPTKVKS